MIEKFVLQRKVLKKSNSGEIRYFGFSLIEVLISLVLLGIGLSFSAKAFVAGKFFMKNAENKTRAMEIASVHMNEYVTKSYDELDPGETVPVTDANGFTWTAKIDSLAMSPKAGTGKINTIPYKAIEVVCRYNEQNINGVVAAKSVRLVNMVVYPYMHLYSLAVSPTTAEARCYGNPCTTSATIAGTNPLSTLMQIDFETKVQSDLMVFYNISIDIASSMGPGPADLIGPTDLIFTKCFITNISSGVTQEYDIQTGTPIMTQPTINNTVSIPILATGKYRLKIVWFKDHSAGTIKGKKANIVIFQVEK